MLLRIGCVCVCVCDDTGGWKVVSLERECVCVCMYSVYSVVWCVCERDIYKEINKERDKERDRDRCLG